MLLVVDVGNTHITLGVFDGKELKATFRATAKQPRTSDEYGIQLPMQKITASLKKTAVYYSSEMSTFYLNKELFLNEIYS